MKILVLSDSHGRVDRLCRAVELGRDADVILHLGDGYRDLRYVNLPDVPIYTVKGNGEDWFVMSDDVPQTRMISLDGVNILMMHGHTYSVKSGIDRAVLFALDSGADILLFGHTHSALEKYLPEGSRIGERITERNLYLFNPGSVGEPRFGEPKFGIITIMNGQILLSHGEIDM